VVTRLIPDKDPVVRFIPDLYPIDTRLMSDPPSSPDPFVRSERTVTKPERKRVLTEKDKERLRKQLDENRDKAVAARKANAAKRRELREALKAKQDDEDRAIVEAYKAKRNPKKKKPEPESDSSDGSAPPSPPHKRPVKRKKTRKVVIEEDSSSEEDVVVVKKKRKREVEPVQQPDPVRQPEPVQQPAPPPQPDPEPQVIFSTYQMSF